MEKNIYDRFLNEKIIIPFGRIIRGGILKPPRNESMIGRKGHKEFLISWLREPKKNGAFLITGNRGSGKTSFVNHCVSKYNINLYSRLVQNEVHLKKFDYILHFFIIGFISLLITLSIGLFTLKNPSVFIYSFIWPILLLPFLAIVNYCFLFFKIYYDLNYRTPTNVIKLELFLVLRFILLLVFSLNISTYVTANIIGYIFFYEKFNLIIFNQILTSIDLILLVTILLFFINPIISHIEEHKTKKYYKLIQLLLHLIIGTLIIISTYILTIILGISILFNLALLVPLFIYISFSNHHRIKLKYKKHNKDSKYIKASLILLCVILLYFSIQPASQSILSVLIYLKVHILNMNDKTIFIVIISTFLFFSYVEYYFFMKQFIDIDISSGKSKVKNKEKLVFISQWSIPVLIIKHYIPTITISLNMGFKNLQHSNIIHAMLTDLKSKYRDIFLGRNHIYNNILPIIVVLISLSLWNVISGSFIYEAITHKFHNKTFIEQEVKIGIANNNKSILLKLFSNKTSEHIVKKGLEKNNSSKLVNDKRIKKLEERLLVLQLINLKTNYQKLEISSLNELLEEQKLYQKRIELAHDRDNLINNQNENNKYNYKRLTIQISILDIIGIFIIFTVFYAFLYYRPLTKSRKNMSKIDNLLHKLSAKITTSKSLRNSLKKGFIGIDKSKTTSLETNPVDSRIVEIEMLELLTEIRQDKGSWFLSPGNIWTIPAPSIIFIFDELDKLHNHDEDMQKTIENDRQKNYSENEAARTYQIKKLLSDMKNFINTAPAKFIFVAGRDLHDQWLADTNSRETFLTSIFDSEIYIPSLLTDHSSADGNIKSNIIKFVNVQYKKAEYQFCTKNMDKIIYRRKNQLKHFQLFLTDQKYLSKSYVKKYAHKNTVKSLCDDLLVFNYSFKSIENKLDPLIDIYKEKFILDYIRFLTYRSQGNPKQLERNLFGFTRENYLENTLKDDPQFKRWKELNYFCVNALEFGDHEIFRIQFIAEIYQQIDNKVGNYIMQTDDKMAMAVFYLSDFIMKFHDTSFSWRHLIKLDELAHIHRLPDLHNVFKRMVQHFSGIYLHRVLNGIFTYRFRSDVSKEITYLSKISDVENASFNFTLDESGDLKNIFRRKIKDKKRASWDLTSGLGDLFELDGEFDDARHQYIGAIDILDKKYQMDHGNESHNAINAIFLMPTFDNSKSPLRLNIKWINERLSLMLLIGLTYEKEGRLTAAMSHYRDTKSLAKLAFNNYLGTFEDIDQFKSNSNLQHNRNEVLKHFNILYQPLFAEAWLVEKLMGGVDTSLAIVEKGVKLIRNALPFIGNIQNEYNTSSSKVPHSNFAILASSMHNKTGDLAFFKGGQKKIESYDIVNNLKIENVGYLHRAMFHYAIALHEIRRFRNYRFVSSGKKFNPHRNKISNRNINTLSTILPSSKTDFINLTFASNLIDLGESCIAKVELNELFEDIGNANVNLKNTTDQLVHQIDLWGFKSNIDSSKDNSIVNPEFQVLDDNQNTICSFGKLQDWFGSWNLNQSKYDDENLITFKNANTNQERLLAGLLLSWVGINKMEQGGYLESASKEYVELANATLNIVWWHNISTQKVNKDLPKSHNKKNIELLIKLAISCLNSALNASLKNRTSVISPKKNIDTKGMHPEFNIIMPEIITTAYSALLLIECFQISNINIKKSSLFNNIATYTNFNIENYKNRVNSFLIKHLTYNRYPMLNRLRGMTIMVYFSAFNGSIINAGDITSTIINYNDTYDAPFHYTYLELGICAFLSHNESNKKIIKLEKLIKLLEINKVREILSEINNSKIELNKLKKLNKRLKFTKAEINKLKKRNESLKKFNKIQKESMILIKHYKLLKKLINRLNNVIEELKRVINYRIIFISESLDMKKILNTIINSYNKKNENKIDFNQGKFDKKTKILVKEELRIEKSTYTWFKNIAIKNLENSIGSHSMGKTYYENITKLYYLYDDFNDRRIHLNQAMQMLGTSMAENLLTELKKSGI